MTIAQGSDPTEFVAPGPGTWLLDGVHMPRPFTRFQQAIHPSGILEGGREGFIRYGLLVDGLDFRMVRGLGYLLWCRLRNPRSRAASKRRPRRSQASSGAPISTDGITR